MAESYKVCPICDTYNHTNASVCTTCGTDLSKIESFDRQGKTAQPNKREIDYDFRYGETDLLEGSLSGIARTYLVFGITLLIGILIGGFGLAFVMGWFSSDGDQALAPSVQITDTPAPTLQLATVTLGPPTVTYTFMPSATFTPSVTPTRGPCQITIQTGGTMTGALTNCGHRSLDVLPTVLALNNISDASQVRVGQTLLIPWPTSTIDPNAVPTEAPTIEGEASTNREDNGNVVLINEAIDAFAATITPTLPAGIQWHYVQPQQNLISIIVQYEADVKTLSELNREIDFARCDFGQRFGGPECIVQLFQGQQLRVPAPTPTPTYTPSPDPNATVTPTPTATVNVPSVYSPADKAFFYKDEIVTLRWVPSATLRSGETYRVDVEDLATGEMYVGYTQDISFPMPLDWRGTSVRRHDYVWTVGIVSLEAPDDVRFQTDPRTFVWEGQEPES